MCSVPAGTGTTKRQSILSFLPFHLTSDALHSFGCLPTTSSSPPAHLDSLRSSLPHSDALHTIGYQLLLADNAHLTSLRGLSHLASLGEDLFVRRNPQLSSLEGLDALAAVGGSVYVQDNGVLTSLGRVPETLKGHVTGMQDNGVLTGLGRVPETLKGHVTGMQDNGVLTGLGRVPETLKGHVTGMRGRNACSAALMPPG